MLQQRPSGRLQRNNMQAKPGTVGQCGCGRSPTGKCCGWHALTEGEYRVKKDEYDLAQYRNQAEDLWFSGGSCTGGKPE
jgi:hypothetical protein